MSAKTKSRPAHFIVAVFSQLGWPLLWGMAGFVGFYLALEYGLIGSETMQRYFMGHPVEYIESALFFIGLAALLVRMWNIMGQHFSLAKVSLPAAPEGGHSPDDAAGLLAWVDGLPVSMHQHYLVRRLRDAFTYVQQKGTADDLDDQLRHLADEDYARQHDGYSLVRLVIWAIPILGFLGTVIGITMAISQLAPESLTESTAALTSSLSVAFDTTTVALGLSIVLMFAQFLIERFESELLASVNARATDELIGRFESLGSDSDPLVKSVRRMTTELITASQQMVSKQAELWKDTIDEAHTRWASLGDKSSEQFQTTLASSIDSSLEKYTKRLTETAEATSQRIEELEVAAAARRSEDEAASMDRLAQSSQTILDGLAESEKAASDRVELLNSSLSDAVMQYAQAVKSQQGELVRQGEALQQAIQASGQVTQLQDTLNQNLQSLAGAKHFEDILASLSAAVHLLTTRVNGAGSGYSLDAHKTTSPQDRAA